MTLQSFSREVYQYFFFKIYRHQPLTTRSRENELLYDQFVQSALRKYKSIGPDFVWLYVAYQFGRFQKSQFALNSYSKRVDPVNVFGRSPFIKFAERRQDLDDLTLKSDYLIQYQITKEDFTAKTRLNFILHNNTKKVLLRQAKKLQKYRSPIKEAASREEFALEICRDLTDLYTETDPSCQRCLQAEECKLLLKNQYPHLYKLKGYE